MIYIRNNRGFTLIETLVYIAGVVLILGIIVDVLFYAYRWYGTVYATSRVDQVGISLVDRLINDIRSGQSVDNGSRSFSINSGSLSITTLTAPATTMTKSYAVSGGRVTYRENVGTTQYLSPNDLYISQFRIEEPLITPASSAIRFTVSIDQMTRTGTTTSNYSGMAIMRNSYK